MLELKKAQLKLTAAKIRRRGLEIVYKATSGHIGGSFSLCNKQDANPKTWDRLKR